MDVARLAEVTGDLLTVKRVFGEAYERDEVTVIPVATVRGAVGGGGGESEQPDGSEQEGEGGGLGVMAKPAGVYVISDGKVRWMPAVDVNRIVVGGQLLGLAFVLARTVLKRKAR